MIRAAAVGSAMVCALAIPAPIVHAQSRVLVVTPGVARGWFSHIYDGVIAGSQSGTFQVYQDGVVALTRPTLVTARLTVQPPRWSFAVYGAASFGNARMRSWGGDQTHYFESEVDAKVRMFSIGVLRAIPLGHSLPHLELGIGGVLANLVPAAEPFMFPALPEFRSAGGEVTVTVQYPNPASRFGLEVRTSWSVVRHETETLSSGVQLPGEPSPSHQWAGNILLGVGARVGLW